MLFDVALVRQGGWVLPRFRSCMLPAVRGELEVFDSMDVHLRRATRIVRLLDPKTGQPLPAPPPLHDAVLLCARSDYLTLFGIERVQDKLAERCYEYAQSWILTPVASQMSNGALPRSW